MHTTLVRHVIDIVNVLLQVEVNILIGHDMNYLTIPSEVENLGGNPSWKVRSMHQDAWCSTGCDPLTGCMPGVINVHDADMAIN
jgi:hypothetical protein